MDQLQHGWVSAQKWSSVDHAENHLHMCANLILYQWILSGAVLSYICFILQCELIYSGFCVAILCVWFKYCDTDVHFSVTPTQSNTNQAILQKMIHHWLSRGVHYQLCCQKSSCRKSISHEQKDGLCRNICHIGDWPYILHVVTIHAERIWPFIE